MFFETRKEDTVLNRLHIFHFYLMHSFILNKEEPPACVACNTVIIIKHILIECADFVEIYFDETFLYSLFRNVNLQKNVDFLEEIDMFCRV